MSASDAFLGQVTAENIFLDNAKTVFGASKFVCKTASKFIEPVIEIEKEASSEELYTVKANDVAVKVLEHSSYKNLDKAGEYKKGIRVNSRDNRNLFKADKKRIKAIYQNKIKEQKELSGDSNSEEIKNLKSEMKGLIKDNKHSYKTNAESASYGKKLLAKREKRKANSKLAVANAIKASSEFQKSLTDTKTTGDALKDGQTGLVKFTVDHVNPAKIIARKVTEAIRRALMALLQKVLSAIALLLSHVIIFLFFGAIIIVPLIVPLLLINSVSPNVSCSEAEKLQKNYKGISGRALSQAEIDQLVNESGGNETQKNVVRNAVSRVGWKYSQGCNRSNPSGSVDCSTLAYISWKEAGIKINNSSYAPSASEEARGLENSHKEVADNESLMPGDLIFYSYKLNGRYRNISHVAIYIGNGKICQAENEKNGVTIRKFVNKSIICICRPDKS